MGIYDNLCSIGDSHAGTFYTYCRNVCAMGPVTMYSLTTNKLQEYITYLLGTQEITYQDWWVFCVGEIDIRCLFYKQIYELNRNEENVVTSLVDSYLNNLESLNHNKIITTTTVPPVQTLGDEHKLQNTVNSIYPIIGSDADRHRWAIKLNSYLLKQCNIRNILCIDLYSIFVDHAGFINQDYVDEDMVHVSDNRPLSPVLQQLNLS